MAGEFYILSLKWSPIDNRLVWWRPNSCGYTTELESAGRYTAEEIEARRSYYDNGDSTLAVPCKIAEALAVRIVPTDALPCIRAWKADDYVCAAQPARMREEG
ncbi:MAG: hypothetical protein IRY96_08425 [Burkholderiales bacterium]|nr:hypothetical protein [Burkholderiales bacterium]